MEWGLRVVLSGHFCASSHVGHARPVCDYKITDLEAQIKTKNETFQRSFVILILA